MKSAEPIRLFPSVEEDSAVNPLCIQSLSPVKAVAFSPDGKHLAIGCEDCEVVLWSMAAQKEIFKLKKHTQQITSVAFSQEGKNLATGGRDGCVVIWNLY